MSTRGGGNMLLFVLSALLASTMVSHLQLSLITTFHYPLQIYNVSKQINSVELQQLEQFVNFARNAVQVLGSQQQGGSSNTAVEEEETGKLFQVVMSLNKTLFQERKIIKYPFISV
jgi:hypothetical protein